MAMKDMCLRLLEAIYLFLILCSLLYKSLQSNNNNNSQNASFQEFKNFLWLVIAPLLKRPSKMCIPNLENLRSSLSQRKLPTIKAEMKKVQKQNL